MHDAENRVGDVPFSGLLCRLYVRIRYSLIFLTAATIRKNTVMGHQKNLFCARHLLIVPILMMAAACDIGSSDPDPVESTPPDGDEWLIPFDEIVDGGPARDGVPSVDQPEFAPARSTTYIPDYRRIIGVHVNGEIRAYPHQILDWHEIVNDEIGGAAIALVYCPLTGTGVCWNRTIGGETVEFGVSGLLFRNNQIAYDRNTESYWLQMHLRSVFGPHRGYELETCQVVETTWATWKAMYPESRVLTTNTGHRRDYDGYAYGADFATNHDDILYPVNKTDIRLRNKDRVHGILGPRTPDDRPLVRIYALKHFGDGVSVFLDRMDTVDYLVVGSSDYDFAAAFRMDPGSDLDFRGIQAVQDELPVVMQDADGNRWDIFGRAVEGPRAGERLTPARGYTGYWYAWVDVFPILHLHQRR